MTIFRTFGLRSFEARLALLGACALLPMTAAQASSHHRQHHHAPPAPAQVVLDLSPVVVQPYIVPQATDPKQASFLRRMNLENGVEVRSTRDIQPADVTSRDLFILSLTQSLEGGFDSVNVYDKGVLSWGVMQWTAGTDSLPPVLTYIKRRLIGTGQRRVWDKVFVAQGLDADARGLIAYGKPLSTSDDMRLAFRGSAIPGNYDPKIANYWATVFARAGRQPAVQKFQCEYAERRVDSLLAQKAPGQSATLAGVCGNDPFAEALLFALWTNNPRHALEYVSDAAQSARQQTGESDPALWGTETFRNALLARCRVSRFGNWPARAALIAGRAEALHTAAPPTLTPYERVCQAALSKRKVQLAGRHKPVPTPRPLLSKHKPTRHDPPRHGILKVS